MSLIACFLAVFRDWRPYLSPGEVGTIKVIATDRRQARVIHRYCRALLTQVPAFASLISRETDDELILSNRVTIEIQTASFRSVRGFTCIAVLADEIAFWRSDENSANPDSEIIAAIRPAMATVPGAMFLAASSPYARRGELYQAHRHFVSREVVDAAVVPGRRELPRLAHVAYRGFVDPSGGGADAMTLAIAHRDPSGAVVLDLVRERRPPFSPEQVAGEFAGTLRAYGVHRVTGDHYAGMWPKEQFAKHGVHYETSDRSKSEIYQESLPLLNSGKIELLDHPRLAAQLCGLERRTARSGKDLIDHSPGAHDDLINAALGALLLASRAAARMILPPDQLRRLAAIPPRDRFSRSGAMTRFNPRQLGLL